VAEGHAVQGVDAVEELEHTVPDRFVELLDIGEELFEPIEETVEVLAQRSVSRTCVSA